MKNRNRNLVVRCSDAELTKIHELVAEECEPAAVLVRRWIRQHHEARFGRVTVAVTKSGGTNT
jgi:hypothetical protein